MKRDMDLIRQIMIEVEKNPDPMAWAEVNLSGHSEEEISYHIMLLYERGLVEATDCSFATTPSCPWIGTGKEQDSRKWQERATPPFRSST